MDKETQDFLIYRRLRILELMSTMEAVLGENETIKEMKQLFNQLFDRYNDLVDHEPTVRCLNTSPVNTGRI